MVVVDAPGWSHRPVEGDSISINGCCLTVCLPPQEHEGGVTMTFDVIPRTLEMTTLGSLAEGGEVNLESALRAGDPIGGHYVQGHVDGVGSIDSLEESGDDRRVWITPPAELGSLVQPRGSIAVDGVSLTVAETSGDRFSVALIPVTLRETTLGQLEPGCKVNLECDMLARAVARVLEHRGGG